MGIPVDPGLRAFTTVFSLNEPFFNEPPAEQPATSPPANEPKLLGRAIKQIGLKGTDQLTRRDKDLIAHYERLRAEFSAMPAGDRGWITNKNWVIATPLQAGIAPRARAPAAGQDPAREQR